MGQAPLGESYNVEGRGLPLLAGAGDLGDVFPKPKKFTDSPTQVSRPGDIVLIRATIGDRNWADREYCLGRGVAALRPSSTDVDVRYLWHWLGTSQQALERAARGSTFRQVDKAAIGALMVPLPDLPEQRLIAAVLDQADAIRRKGENVSKLTAGLMPSTFQQLFGDPVVNPMSWPIVALRDVSDIRSGVTKGRRLRGETTLVPYLRVANVQDGFLNLEKVTDIEASSVEVERYRLQPGDVVLTEGGDPDKLGRGAVWRGEVDPCIHQNHVFRVRARTEMLLGDFLAAQLCSLRGKRYFLKAAKQTTGIASINMSQLSAFPVLLPPLSLQARFGELKRQIEAVEGRLAAADQLAVSLGASITDRVFRLGSPVRETQALA